MEFTYAFFAIIIAGIQLNYIIPFYVYFLSGSPGMIFKFDLDPSIHNFFSSQSSFLSLALKYSVL
jgi:hypothetical protein